MPELTMWHAKAAISTQRMQKPSTQHMNSGAEFGEREN